MKRLRYFAIVLLASAFLLEIVLQVGAVVTYLVHSRDASSTVDESSDLPSVLCVGDSYTYGDGASTAYRVMAYDSSSRCTSKARRSPVR